MSSLPFAAVNVENSLEQRYCNVREATLRLVSGLSPEDLMLQSMPDVSPAKWHLAHSTWFFETFVLARIPVYREFHPDFRRVFNSYYKQVGEHPLRSSRSGFSRPTFQQVLQYREHVDNAIRKLLKSQITAEVADLIVLGLNHEQQHQELIVTDLKHAFWSQPLRPALYWAQYESAPSLVAGAVWKSFKGGIVEVGHNGNSFAFDNELPRHKLLLNPYSLSSRLVTNREFLEFMDDSGYQRPEFWLSDGWDTVNQQRWEAPLYWERDGSQWLTFTAAGMQPIALDEPVCHISYYESDAFAHWAGARLPLESEWEHATDTVAIKGNFVEHGRFQPAPASTGNDLQQMFGDVWEWTSSAYSPYPGFKTASGAVGEYNGKFMCNQFVLRGGSCATPQSHVRATYRNFFPPHARWQFMGVRLAKNEY